VVNRVYGPVDPVELGPWWTGHHGRPLELGHGPLWAPGDCTDSMGRWRGGRGCSLAVRFGGGVSQSSRRWGNAAAVEGVR
jgi:hypothetical protein